MSGPTGKGTRILVYCNEVKCGKSRKGAKIVMNGGYRIICQSRREAKIERFKSSSGR
jgi:hypothetical protein